MSRFRGHPRYCGLASRRSSESRAVADLPIGARSGLPHHSATANERRFVEGKGRVQGTLFPECLEDWIGEDNPVRVIDVFVDELDLAELDTRAPPSGGMMSLAGRWMR
jgi:hypothetical protein